MTIHRPVIGDAAPDITLVDRDGTAWHLADQRGGPIVLIFHRHIH